MAPIVTVVVANSISLLKFIKFVVQSCKFQNSCYFFSKRLEVHNILVNFSDVLRRKGVDTGRLRVMCNPRDDTVNHLFLKCSYSREVVTSMRVSCRPGSLLSLCSISISRKKRSNRNIGTVLCLLFFLEDLRRDE